MVNLVISGFVRFSDVTSLSSNGNIMLMNLHASRLLPLSRGIS